MEKFESVIIFNENIEESDIDNSLTFIFSDVPINHLKNKRINMMGIKKLAYPIRGQENAYYVDIKFETKVEYIAVIERKCRVEDSILKFIFVKEIK